VSGAAATSDLVKLALALLQAGGKCEATRSIKSFARIALMQTAAALSAAAAFGCALGALWIYAAPIFGAAGALLADAGILCAIAIAALVLARRAPASRSQSLGPSSQADASLAAATALFKQHKGLALLAAFLAGAFVAGEN
jgi:hypothetical protein